MLRFCSLLILAAFLFFSCVSIGFVDDYDKCGDKQYTAVNQICENNVIKTQCGKGSNYYNSTTQFCSDQDTKIYNKCGGKSYNTSNQICDDSIIKTQCETGNGYHVPETQFCNGDDVFDKCDGKEYEPETQRCNLNNVIETKCGDDYYNPSVQFCFAYYEVFDKCNGKDDYNPITEFCSEQDAKIYSKCEGLTYNTTNQRCPNNIVVTRCGSSYYDSTMQFCFNQDSKIYNKCGGKDYNPVTQFCFAQDSEVYNKCGGIDYNPITYSCDEEKGFLFYYFTDDRNDREYKAVVIGSQTWMAENLNYDGYYCYDQDPDNCEKYGMLYIATNVDNVCPSGWRLPGKKEWETLASYVGGDSIAGNILKASNGWGDNGNGTDDYGFSALPGGAFWNGFNYIGSSSMWWTSDSRYENSIPLRDAYLISSNNSRLISFSSTYLSLFYIRCIKR